MYYFPVQMAHPLNPTYQPPPQPGPVAPGPTLEELIGFDPYRSYAPQPTPFPSPGASATATVPAGVAPPPTVGGPAAQDPGLASQVVDFITHPLTQGAMNAISGMLMTPKWAGPGYGLATALQMGSQGVVQAKQRQQQAARDAAYNEFMRAQAEKMSRPETPGSVFNKPSHPSSWATPESVSAWERTISPDKPYGDWSVLKKAPRALTDLEKRKLEAEITRINREIQTATSDGATWGEVGAALNALQSIRKQVYFDDLPDGTKLAIDNAIRIAAEKLRHKTASGAPFNPNDTIDPNNPESVKSALRRLPGF